MLKTRSKESKGPPTPAPPTGLRDLHFRLLSGQPARQMPRRRSRPLRRLWRTLTKILRTMKQRRTTMKIKRLKLDDEGDDDQEEELDTVALEDEEEEEEEKLHTIALELDEDNVICKSPVNTNKCVMHWMNLLSFYLIPLTFINV